jgi:hypothetical protein
MMRICKGGERKYKSLGLSINPKEWNDKKEAPKTGYQNAELLTKLIADEKQKYLSRILSFRAKGEEFTAARLLDDPKPAKVVTVDDAFREYISSRKSGGRTNYAEVILSSYNALKNFN